MHLTSPHPHTTDLGVLIPPTYCCHRLEPGRCAHIMWGPQLRLLALTLTPHHPPPSFLAAPDRGAASAQDARGAAGVAGVRQLLAGQQGGEGMEAAPQVSA